MSIVQVMDSTKSGRAIYVVASSLIVSSIVFFVLEIARFFEPSTIQLSEVAVELVIGLTSIVGFLSLLLWIRKPERSIVESWVIKSIYEKDTIKDIRIRMASALFYIRPWESSPKEATLIEESLLSDIERILRSPEFKDQIDNYKTSILGNLADTNVIDSGGCTLQSFLGIHAWSWNNSRIHSCSFAVERE
jgi:hypothetical protein